MNYENNFMVKISLYVDKRVQDRIKEYLESNPELFTGYGHFYRAAAYNLIRELDERGPVEEPLLKERFADETK